METAVEEDISLKKTAGKLLIAAWCIEIIAASMGLFFAVSRILPALDGTFANSLTGFQGALPFVAVAIVELTKIPLAYACYETNDRRWKFLFGFSLAAVVFITFETFFLGFEGYQSNITRELRPTLDEYTSLNRKIETANNVANLAAGIAEGQTDARKRNSADVNQVNVTHGQAVRPLLSQKQEIEDKYDISATPLKNRLSRLEEDRAQLDLVYADEKKKFNEEINASLEDEKGRYKQRVDELREQLKVEQAAFNKTFALESQARKEIKADAEEAKKGIIFGKTKIDNDANKAIDEYSQNMARERARYKLEVQKIKDELSNPPAYRETLSSHRRAKLDQLKTRYQEDRKNLLIQIGEIEQNITTSQLSAISLVDQARIKRIDILIDQEEKKRKESLDRIAKAFEAQNNNYQDQEKRILSSTTDIENAQKELEPVCSTLNEKVIDNQVYRLAMWWSGIDDACKLKAKDLSQMKTLWFGSLALIIAALGTILAFASFVISQNKPRIILQEVSVEKLVEVEVVKEVPVEKIVEVEVVREVVVEKPVPVEVIKEVPVDKVVFKEVPVEIVKKEVVHIPVYTDDKSLLGKTFSDNDKT
jgi:hypothetical protein